MAKRKVSLNVIDASGNSVSQKELPPQFSEEVRPDIIKRAVLSVQNAKRQPYGADPDAGKKTSAKLSRRRRKYRGSYGHGISRVPRKILSRRGTRLNWVGAFAPGTVGGRRAHPPKAGRIFTQKINRKERRKAIRSALAATMDAELVKQRGHAAPASYPFLLESGFEALSRTSELVSALEKLGLKDELKRTYSRKVRHGKGKSRGRKYKTSKGILIITSGECPLSRASGNIAGVDHVAVDRLNAEILAPGAEPGRLALFTSGAIDRLASESLFTNSPVKVENPEKNEKNKTQKQAGKPAPGGKGAALEKAVSAGKIKSAPVKKKTGEMSE